MQEQVTRMYRVKAVAEMFDVSVHTIYRAIKAGSLDAYKVGGAIRITAESLATFKEACADTAYKSFVLGDESPAVVDGAEADVAGEVA